MDTHRLNIEKLQDFLCKLCTLCKVNILYIKEELVKLKVDIDEQKKYMSGKYMEIIQAWEKSNEDMAISFREQTQRLTVDHELELSDMKASLHCKDEIINSLKSEYKELKVEHQKVFEKLEMEHQATKDVLEKTRDEIKSFEKKLDEMETQKQKEIKELQEKMHLDFKAEIESMRSR